MCLRSSSGEIRSIDAAEWAHYFHYSPKDTLFRLNKIAAITHTALQCIVSSVVLIAANTIVVDINARHCKYVLFFIRSIPCPIPAGMENRRAYDALDATMLYVWKKYCVSEPLYSLESDINTHLNKQLCCIKVLLKYIYFEHFRPPPTLLRLYIEHRRYILCSVSLLSVRSAGFVLRCAVWECSYAFFFHYYFSFLRNRAPVHKCQMSWATLKCLNHRKLCSVCDGFSAQAPTATTTITTSACLRHNGESEREENVKIKRRYMFLTRNQQEFWNE